LEPNKVEIICMGWNGLKLHCQGRTWDLSKGDTFTSETEGAEIMIDVQDARVLVQWPRKDKDRELSDSSWDDSPRSRVGGAAGLSMAHGSPLRRSTRIESPESPTPANVSSGSLLPDTADSAAVQIYEDNSADEQELPKLNLSADTIDVATSHRTDITNSFSSDLSDPLSDGENDPDEENDPIVHSFGPFGANLSTRLASFTTMSPKRPQVTSRVPSGDSDAPPLSKTASLQSSPKASVSASEVDPAMAARLELVDKEAITNHVINQLAFSRLSSNPLTGILNNLPTAEQKNLDKDMLRIIIEATPCVGIIPRQGKDAAGKALESEYYYVPELDTDEHRRLAVTDGLRKPSLRNCRKQHKVSIYHISNDISLPPYIIADMCIGSNTTGNALEHHNPSITPPLPSC
jgi:hypothetical protein